MTRLVILPFALFDIWARAARQSAARIAAAFSVATNKPKG